MLKALTVRERRLLLGILAVLLLGAMVKTWRGQQVQRGAKTEGDEAVSVVGGR